MTLLQPHHAALTIYTTGMKQVLHGSFEQKSDIYFVKDCGETFSQDQEVAVVGGKRGEKRGGGKTEEERIMMSEV